MTVIEFIPVFNRNVGKYLIKELLYMLHHDVIILLQASIYTEEKNVEKDEDIGNTT